MQTIIEIHNFLVPYAFFGMAILSIVGSIAVPAIISIISIIDNQE